MQRAAVAAFLRRRLEVPLPERARTTDVERGVWARLARAIMRRPLVFLAGGTTVLLVAAAPAFALQLTPASLAGIPGSSDAMRGYAALSAGVGTGALTPTQVVVDSGAPGAARRPPTRRAVSRLADELFHDPEVHVVASGHVAPYVDPSGRYARVFVAGRHEYGAEPTRRLVRRIRERLVPAARFPAGDRVEVDGVPAQGVDFLDRSYGAFPWLVLGVLALTYAVLLRAFRSLLLPLKAVLLNLLTVAAAYGLLVVTFRWGVGSHLLGLYRAQTIEGWIPIFLFATLFGLSMDYEVFLVSRIRESWDRVPDNTRAVAHGLERTGRVVSAAAAIMVVTFLGFLAGHIAALQELGVGLAFAVIIDATIVRALLVPSVMAVLGRWNWWLPDRVARLVRVAPSPTRVT
jgi:putative drug exporter of the RND superfamily